MKLNVEMYHKTRELPASWDQLAGSYFKTRPFLEHCERWNPCGQRYYLAFDNDQLQAGAIVYNLRLNIFTYARMKVLVTTNITGVPCSVSSSGLIGEEDRIHDLFTYICNQEPGLSLALNLSSVDRNSDKFAIGNTLPAVISDNIQGSWDGYLNSIRAPYRRRLRNIMHKSERLKLDRNKCDVFSREMHQLYLQVYERSEAKMECLSYEFFKNLPNAFKLTTAHLDKKVVGWTITIMDSEVFYFFLGGVDYAENDLYNVYLRLLSDVYQHGIESGAKQIDLGQTAEVPKLRLGGETRPLYMNATHSNLILAKLLKWSMSILDYRRDISPHCVFKENL